METGTLKRWLSCVYIEDRDTRVSNFGKKYQLTIEMNFVTVVELQNMKKFVKFG